MTTAELLAEIERLVGTVKRLEAPGIEVLVPLPIKTADAILSALRGVEAAREFLDLFVSGSFPGASSFALADIKNFRAVNLRAKEVLAALSQEERVTL